MARYKRVTPLHDELWIDTETGASFGNSETKEYLAYQEWLAQGGVPDAADPLPPVYNNDAKIRAHVRTTDATPTELYRVTLRAATIYDVEMRVLGVDAGNGATKKLVVDFTIKRVGAGNGATLVGTPEYKTDKADAAASNWNISPHLDGNDFVVTVTGVAGRNISWTMLCVVDTFSPGGV